MRKPSKDDESGPLVVPGVTDEDPMTSRRVTRQPKKKNPIVAAAGRAVRSASEKVSRGRR